MKFILHGSFTSFLHTLEMLEANKKLCYYKCSCYRVHDMQPAHEYYSGYLMIAYFRINFAYKQCIPQVSATLLAQISCWKCIEQCIPK